MTSVEITVSCNISPLAPGNPVTLVKMRNGVSDFLYMYTLGAGRILIKSIITVCRLNLMAWKASWAHRTGENETSRKHQFFRRLRAANSVVRGRI